MFSLSIIIRSIDRWSHDKKKIWYLNLDELKVLYGLNKFMYIDYFSFTLSHHFLLQTLITSLSNRDGRHLTISWYASHHDNMDIHFLTAWWLEPDVDSQLLLMRTIEK